MVVIIRDACKISDDLNFLGFIYKIYAKDYPHRIYIGQTRGRTSQGKEKILDIRWRRHCKDAKDSRKKEFNLSKAADLHIAMIANSIPNIKFDVLETYQSDDKNELINKLREREEIMINQYNSIENGLNKIHPPKTRLPIGQNEEETWGAIADKYEVDVRKLSYQMNKNNNDLEKSLKEIEKLEMEPERRYSYGKQIYKQIRELLIYDINKIGKKNIERRIRDSLVNGCIKKDFQKDKNIEIIYLEDHIFLPISNLEIYSVNTPKGIFRGNIAKLHNELQPLFPEIVPESYNTVQSRIKEKGWTADQAFGFRYPKGLEEIEDLIENKFYKWGIIDGEVYIPNFRKLKTIPSPIIMHSIKEIYLYQKDWMNAYKLRDHKKIKELRDVKQQTPEEILKFWNKEP